MKNVPRRNCVTKDHRASASLPSGHPLYAPGLNRRPRAGGEALYWMPSPRQVKAGYPVKCLTIPPGPEAEIAALCRAHDAELQAWKAGIPSGPQQFSIAWLIGRYLHDDFSPYQRLRFNSQRSYLQDCDIIKSEIGERRLDPKNGTPRVIGEDVWRWHRAWGYPDSDGQPTSPSRARHLITQFRMLVKYGVAIGVPGTPELLAVLSAIRFPTTEPRSVAPDRAQVMALVAKATAKNLTSLAVTTLAQFEFTERRISIIGAWDGSQWRPGWTWQNISKDWIIRYTQNKTGTVNREYDLKETPLLLELLQRTPEDKRVGPVIVCETTGRPWKEDHYTKIWRKIARKAGIPDTICSMDMRAGGATEADSIPGVSDRALQDAGGWRTASMRDRYRKDKQRNAQNVVKLRQQAKE
jgi:integrase